MFAIAPRSPFGPGFTLPRRPGREGGGAVTVLVCALLALAFSSPAFAQNWPDKPVRLSRRIHPADRRTSLPGSSPTVSRPDLARR